MSALSGMELDISVLTTADGVDDTERDDQMPCLELQQKKSFDQQGRHNVQDFLVPR